MDLRALSPWSLGLAFLWGAVWGSFFNVVVHRLPLGKSLVRPASHCPRCGTPIRPWHNVPILSWLWLRGRCAACREPISVRYPLVELTSAVLAVAVWQRCVHATTDPVLVASGFVLLFAFVGALLVITFIDLDYRIIPHEITVPGIVLGLLAAVVVEPVTGVSWQQAAIGALIGAGIIWLIIQVYFWIRHRQGMGGGDFMMMGMLGAWLGYEAILFVLLAASLQGTLAAVILQVTGRRLPPPLPLPGEPPPPEDPAAVQAEGFRTMEIPFGPFLALAGLQWLFFAPRILEAFDALMAP